MKYIRKEMTRNAGMAVLLLAAIFTAFEPSRCAAAGRSEGYDYVMGFYFDSVGGNSASFYYDLAKTVTNLATTEIGYRIEARAFPSNESVVEAFKANKIDGALLNTAGILDIIEGGGEVFPWATYVIGKDRKNAICIWHRKNTLFKEMKDLAGKNLIWVGTSYFDYIELRQHLTAAGIDRPLWSVFSSFTLTPNVNSSYIVLAKGEGDVLWGGMEADMILKVMQPDVRAQISYSLCTAPLYNRGMLALNAKTVKKSDLDKAVPSLKKTISSLSAYADKHPQLQAPVKYTQMIKMKFIPAARDEYAYELELYRKAKKNGWLDEARYFTEKIRDKPMGKPVEIRPDMNFCKKICRDKSAECVVGCLE